MESFINFLKNNGFWGNTKKSFILGSGLTFLIVYAFKPSFFFYEDENEIQYLNLNQKLNLPVVSLFGGVLFYLFF